MIGTASDSAQIRTDYPNICLFIKSHSSTVLIIQQKCKSCQVYFALSIKFCIVFFGTPINQRFIEASASGLDMLMSRLRGSSLLVDMSVNDLNAMAVDLLIAIFTVAM